MLAHTHHRSASKAERDSVDDEVEEVRDGDDQ
jgi:hypothetical protein